MYTKQYPLYNSINMKPLAFNIPKTENESFKLQDDKLNHMYDHLHTHPEIQISYIVKGSGTRFIGHSVDDFNPDEIYVIGPNIPHMFKNHQEYYDPRSKNQTHCISIFFREDSFGEMFNKVPELSKIKEFFQISAFGIKLERPYTLDFKGEFQSLIRLEGFERFQYFLSLLQKLAYCSGLEVISLSSLVQQKNEEEGLRLNKIVTYVTQNFSRKITVDQVAREANLSTSAFCRYFKLHTRRPFISYLNEFRIGIACSKLMQKDINISEICYQTGFNNISNFNRQFKAITGFTPSQYLKQGW